MRKCLENEQFDMKVEPSDWRYAAAIVGIYNYLSFYGENGKDFEVTEDAIIFNYSDITEEKYLRFVEYYYGDELLHKEVERIINQRELSNEQIKLVNELLKKNSILKKILGKLKFDGTNQQEIVELIEKNRNILIKETYRNKTNMYANFANKGQLLKKQQDCCRLLGYYVDRARKSRAIAYNFNINTYVAQDDILFDFIPFGFSGDRESFFINDSFSVKQLISTNIDFQQFVRSETIVSDGKTVDIKKVLFKSIQKASDFIDYDVEVIVKKRKNDFFETLYIRRESIEILKELKIYEPFCFSLKINDNYFINIQEEVLICILNLVRTDKLIELLLKRNSEYLVSQFIRINQLICGGGENMKQSMKVAYACAKEVAERLPENKRESYRQKLTSAIVFKDYDRYCQILLQLSNYLNVTFDFAYNLFEDFEANKDIAYTFVNALTKKKQDN